MSGEEMISTSYILITGGCRAMPLLFREARGMNMSSDFCGAYRILKKDALSVRFLVLWSSFSAANALDVAPWSSSSSSTYQVSLASGIGIGGFGVAEE